MNKAFAIFWVGLAFAAIGYVMDKMSSVNDISLIAYVGSNVYGAFMIASALMLKKLSKDDSFFKALNRQFMIGIGLLMLTYAFFELGQHRFLPIGFSVIFVLLSYSAIFLFPVRKTVEILQMIRSSQKLDSRLVTS